MTLLVIDTGRPVWYDVTPYQAEMALRGAGLFDAVVAEIAKDTTSQSTKSAWVRALGFKRDSPMIAEIASKLGMTDAQLDALFQAAALIE